MRSLLRSMLRLVALAAVVLAAALAGAVAARAETLRDVLRVNGVTAARGWPARLDRSITGVVTESDATLLAIAYDLVPDDSLSLPDTLQLEVLDRGSRAWTHAALPRVRATPPEWDVGSLMAIHHAGRYLYLEMHLNPSAGTTIVLNRSLRPIAALDGRPVAVLSDGRVIYEQSMVHFAPTHSVALRTYDPVSKWDVALYPRKPFEAVRGAYVDSMKALYARLGEDWFREHNRSADPEEFDSELLDSVLTDPAGTVAAFAIRFGRDDTEPATPVLEVVVRCIDLQTWRPLCAEIRLDELQRRHPDWTTRDMLGSAVRWPFTLPPGR